MNFNPRSHERSDGYWLFVLHISALFQSTLPREERPISTKVISIIYIYFNPRSHERSDVYSHISSPHSAYFNPRSHERSDAERPEEAYAPEISIHAPTRGATSDDDE